MLTTQDTPATASRWRPSPKSISVGIALLITAVLLYISVRGIDWRQVWRTVSGAKLPYLAMCLALASGTLFLRALRWRILLTAEGPVGMRAVFSATAAGYFGNNFLPARAGELVRTFMVSSRTGLNNAYVLATAISERVADAVALVAISSLVLLTLPQPPGWLANAARPVAILGLAAVLVIVVLPRLESVLQRILDRVPVPATVRTKLKDILENALRGMRTFHDLKRLLAFAAVTVVIWCTDGFMTVLTGWALGLPITLPIAFLLIGGMGLGSAMPSAPGYIGVYQFVGVTVLTPFGIDRADAVAFVLVGEVLQYLVVGMWGTLGIVQYRRMKPRTDGAPQDG
jgi:uncharacterized protein (TIRG00374 family)